MQIPTLWGHNIVIIVTRLQGGQSKTRDFSVSKMSRSGMGTTLPSIYWVMGALSLKKSGQGVRPTTHVH